MKIKLLFIVLMTLLTTIVGFFIFQFKITPAGPASPILWRQTKPSSSPTIAPPNAPKEFKYDKDTDLKKELENINPQLLDSDFE